MYNSVFKSKFLSLTLLVLLISSVLFVACGEEKPPTGAASTATQTTRSTGNSKGNTTPANQGTASSVEVAGASEVPLDSMFLTDVSKLLPGAKNLTARLYVSDDDAEKLANGFDKAIYAKGYTGLSDKPTKSDKGYVGIYAKAASDDLIVTTLATPKDGGELSQSLNFQGLSQSTVNNINKQIKGKTSIAVVLSGQDLIKAVFNASTENTNTPGTINSRADTPTPVITPRVEITTPAVTSTPAITSITRGPGSELIGKLLATENADIKVKKVEGYSELYFEGKSIKPKGIFVVITYDYANIGKKPIALISLSLKDGQGHEYDTTTDSDVVNALIKMGYQSSFVVNPGFIGSEYRVYDLPKEGTGYVLEPLFATDRQPSAASFSSNPGKSSDSGAGPELVGKSETIEGEKVDVKITNVERVSTIKDGAKSLKSDGTFLIVTYEFTNKGEKEATSPLFYLEDSEGRVFSSTDNFDVIFAVANNSKTKFDSSVNPGQSGVSYRVFEVLKDSSGFKPVELS